MYASVKCFAAAVLTGLALLAGCLPDARAQYYPSTYWGYAYNPYTGLGNLVRAQGRFAIDQQEAVLKREEIITARIRNRREKLEQYLWERNNLPTLQDDRERTQRMEARRALDPPVTEIWSAKSLNDLYSALRKRNSMGGQFASMAISPEVLAQINFTSGKSGGNIGLLKGGRISFWPLLLQKKAFAEDRRKIEGLLAEVVKQLERGESGGEPLVQLIMTTREVEENLGSRARALGDDGSKEWTAGMYMDAKRFLRQLEDAYVVLQEPDAGEYLTGRVKITAPTVAALVVAMKKSGVVFAPATPGTYRAYNTLHALLVDAATEAGAVLTTAPK